MKTRRILAKDRKTLNNQIHDLLSPKFKTRYFDEIPLDDLFDICRTWELEPLQEDNTPWDGFLCGREGMVIFPLGDTSHLDHRAGSNEMLPEVTGAALTMTWYKMESGRYEVIAYIG